MMTYLLLNCIVIAIVCLALIKVIRKPSKAEVLTLLVLLALTAVFDNVIVGLGIVSYYPEKSLGIFIGKAPIEDFMYPLLAVIIVPALWRLIGDSRHDK